MIALCALRISETRLLLFRDNALDAQVTAQLCQHLQSCPACAAYLAAVTDCDQLLRRQPLTSSVNVYRMQDQMWRDIHKQIMRGTERNSTMHVSRPTILRSAGALVGAAVVIVLVVQLFAFVGRHHVVAHTTPHPLVANSTDALNLTFPTDFMPEYVAPDGQTLIGATSIINSDPSIDTNAYTDEIDSYSVATKTMTPLYKAPPYEAVGGGLSDGRYVVWATAPLLRSTGTPPNTLVALDRQSMQTRTIASNRPNSTFLALDHGMLIWEEFPTINAQDQTGTGTLNMTNLATGATTPLATSLYQNKQTYPIFHLSWPYIIFPVQSTTAPGSVAIEFMNVTTGSKLVIQQPAALADLPANTMVGYALDGTTVLASWLEGSNKTIAEVSNADQNVNWIELTTLSRPDYFQFAEDAYIQASDRLLFFTGEGQLIHAQGGNKNLLAWSRPLRQPVQLAIYGQSPILAGILSMSGNWLISAFPLGAPATQDAGPIPPQVTGGSATLINVATLVVK